MILKSEGCVKIGDRFYFMAINVNAFFSVNANDGSIAYEGSIPGESPGMDRAAKLFSDGKRLIFIPVNSRYVSFYHLKTKCWKQIEVVQSECYPRDKFFSAHIYKDKLVVVGSVYPALLIIDLNDYSCRYERAMYNKLTSAPNEIRDCLVRADTVVLDGCLFIASCVSNLVGKYDLNEGTWEWIPVGAAGNRYSGIAWDGEQFWLSPRLTGDIVRWNPRNNKSEVVSVCDNRNFLGVVFDGKNIVLPAMGQEETVIIPKDASAQPYPILKENYWFYRNDGDKNYAMTKTGKFIVYDTACPMKPQKEYSMDAKNHEFSELMFDKDRKAIYKENPYITVADFIGGIVQ
jgi:hypothetical protein